MPLDVDRLVGEPDQLHRLVEGGRRFGGHLRRDAGEVAVKKLGVAPYPLGDAAQRLFRRGEERDFLRVALAGFALPHPLQQAAESNLQQLAVAWAQVSLVGDELVGRLTPGVGRDGRRMVRIGRGEPAPQVARLPVLPDFGRHLSLEVAAPLGIHVGANFAEAQLRHQRHGARRFGNRSGEAISGTQIEGHGAEVLAQRHRLAHFPGLVLSLLEHPCEYLRPVQRHAGVVERAENIAP